MKTMGMDATRLRFKTFVQGCRVSNINDWTLDAILSVFKGTQFFADISSVERFLRSAVLSRHITTCTFVVKMQPSAVLACGASMSLHDHNEYPTEMRKRRCLEEHDTGLMMCA
jgi:hypothetical protein